MMVSGSEVLTKRNASSQETASTDEVIPSNTLSQSERKREGLKHADANAIKNIPVDLLTGVVIQLKLIWNYLQGGA
jgi:hypothetical protein